MSFDNLSLAAFVNSVLLVPLPKVNCPNFVVTVATPGAGFIVSVAAEAAPSTAVFPTATLVLLLTLIVA